MQITPDTLPDYHFLLIAPPLDAEWLFTATRAYWERFRPTVVGDGALIGLVPDEYSVIVSVLARRDTFRAVAVLVSQARPDAYLDVLTYDTPAEAQTTLDQRAAQNQPFGVALRPTPIPPTRQPITPTPGAILPNASGFVTQVPTAPAGFVTQTPSPTPDSGS
ncbi:MAG: hypothetical protein ACOYL5_11175 [Phototrophicaceae bacterium]